MAYVRPRRAVGAEPESLSKALTPIAWMILVPLAYWLATKPQKRRK